MSGILKEIQLIVGDAKGFKVYRENCGLVPGTCGNLGTKLGNECLQGRGYGESITLYNGRSTIIGTRRIYCSKV